MELDHQELNEYCEAWHQWCVTRKFFIQPGSKNILARMQPSKVRQPPDAVLSDDLSYFNMAVHALTDMQDEDADCFILFYWFRIKNIKAAAADLGIGRQTFYDRKNRFARKAYSMSLSLKRAHLESIRDAQEVVLID